MNEKTSSAAAATEKNHTSRGAAGKRHLGEQWWCVRDEVQFEGKTFKNLLDREGALIYGRF